MEGWMDGRTDGWIGPLEIPFGFYLCPPRCDCCKVRKPFQNQAFIIDVHSGWFFTVGCAKRAVSLGSYHFSSRWTHYLGVYEDYCQSTQVSLTCATLLQETGAGPGEEVEWKSGASAGLRWDFEMGLRQHHSGDVLFWKKTSIKWGSPKWPMGAFLKLKLAGKSASSPLLSPF